MHPQRWMYFGDAANLVEIDRVPRVRDRIEEVDSAVESAVDRPDPAQERGHPDPARNPYLILAALSIIEAAERTGQFCWDPRAKLAVEIMRVVASGFDRQLEAPGARGTRHREGMALPATGAS